MNAYADTGFLISLYGQDAHSGQARALDRRHRPVYWVTELGEAEFTNAVQGSVFRLNWRLSEAAAVLSLFRDHVETGALEQKALPAEVWKTTTTLSLLHTQKLGTRTLDVLHVATALLLMPDVLFTFDRRQRQLARAVRLRVLPAD